MTYREDEILHFKDNYNNKLHCTYFTTIRLSNKKFQPGKIFGVKYNYVLMNKPVQVVEVKHFYLRDLNEFMAGLDTGYSRAEALAMIRKMYRSIPNLDQARFAFILLKQLDRHPDDPVEKQLTLEEFRNEME